LRYAISEMGLDFNLVPELRQAWLNEIGRARKTIVELREDLIKELGEDNFAVYRADEALSAIERLEWAATGTGPTPVQDDGEADAAGADA